MHASVVNPVAPREMNCLFVCYCRPALSPYWFRPVCLFLQSLWSLLAASSSSPPAWELPHSAPSPCRTPPGCLWSTRYAFTSLPQHAENNNKRSSPPAIWLGAANTCSLWQQHICFLYTPWCQEATALHGMSQNIEHGSYTCNRCETRSFSGE